MIRSPEEVLQWGISRFGNRFAVVTSFQKEGMVLVDLAAKIGNVRVATLDTGKLPEATHWMIAEVKRRYGIEVEITRPDPGETSRMVAAHGEELFRREQVLRKLCCQIRKVRPMAELLKGADAYAVGLRRGQAESREAVEQITEVDGKWKLAPLAHWTAAEVEAYSEANQVPVHPLYAQGYTSIGCDPCTRAVTAGEGERAGRWWWETEGDKECGLHVTPEGRMVRELDVLLGELIHA